MDIEGLEGAEKLHKLGNKNRMTDSNLQCVNCRKERNINLVAHRNDKEYITGFVVVCNDCLRLLEKLNKAVKMVIENE
ncbi:unnamed protein product [marine sediment metagenome]|uniref:Uncharacterized protein n=1 Tax=marine sediment metagenome TaxID=412755 RepID=X1R2B6_9ZZZZ